MGTGQVRNGRNMIRRPLIVIVSFCFVSGMTLTANAQQSLISGSSQPIGDIQQLHQQIATLRQQEEPLKKQIRTIEDQIRTLRLQIIRLGGGHQAQKHNKPSSGNSTN